MRTQISGSFLAMAMGVMSAMAALILYPGGPHRCGSVHAADGDGGSVPDGNAQGDTPAVAPAAEAAGAAPSASHPPENPASDLFPLLRQFANVLHLVQTSYVDEVAPESLLRGAVEGMLGTLDPYTTFLTPEQMDPDLTLGGVREASIGVELIKEGAHLRVVTTTVGSSAARAGVLPGDLIVAIDGEYTAGLPLEEVRRALEGPVGERVSLLVVREPALEELLLEVVRENLELIPVHSRILPGNLVYLQVAAFRDGVAQSVDSHLRRHVDGMEAPGPAGVILDLRCNPGGLLEEAVRLADLFLEEGTILNSSARVGAARQFYRARSDGTSPPWPMVVLINRGTASSSEIVAAALRDNGRARLVGVTSFGKGSVQRVLDLDGGYGLKLTVARYYTPGGEPIERTGIVPEVHVDDGAESGCAVLAHEDDAVLQAGVGLLVN